MPASDGGRRPSGRPSLTEPTLYQPKPRKGHRSEIWYFTFRKLNKSTGLTTKREARAFAKSFVRSWMDGKDGLVDPQRVVVGEALDAFLAWTRLHKPDRLTEVELRVAHLRPFWGERRLVEVAPSADSRSYCDRRRFELGGARGASNASFRKDIDVLNQALRHYAGADPSAGVPTIKVERPTQDPSRVVWLSRDEVARICRAIRGRVWDHHTGDWRRHPSGEPGGRGALVLRPPRSRARMRFLLRLLILGIYSGSRCSVMLEARWEVNARHGHVDPESGEFARRGTLEDEPSNKLRTPTILPTQARVLAALWARNDRAGVDALTGPLSGPVDRVVHRLGEPVSNYRCLWATVRVAAGFGPEVVFHTIRHCTATWLVEGDATIEQAAAFIGVGEETFRRTYLQFAPHFADEAARAMDPRRHNPRRDQSLFGAIEPEVVASPPARPRPRGRDASA